MITYQAITGVEVLRRIADGNTKDLRYTRYEGRFENIDPRDWKPFDKTTLSVWRLSEIVGPSPWKFSVENNDIEHDP